MATPAPAPETRHSIRRTRRSVRKSVVDLSLVTVEMEPAGFGLMLDVSEEGLGAQVMNKIKPGTEVRIKFEVPDSQARVEATGIVNWYDGEGRVGVQFQKIKDENSAVLTQWIATLPEAHTEERKPEPSKGQNPALLEQVRSIQAQIAAAHLNVDLVLQFLVERVVELTRSTGGAIALGTLDEMICRASTGLAPDVGMKISSDSALTAECLRTARTIRCDDTETDSRVDREICRRLDLRSLLILPILYQGKIRGVLEVFAPVPYAFSAQHLSLLEQLAEFTSQIVHETPAEVPPPVEQKAIEPSPAAKTVIEAPAQPAVRPAEVQKIAEVKSNGSQVSQAKAAQAAMPASKTVAPQVPANPRQQSSPAQKPSGRIKRNNHTNNSTGSAVAAAPEAKAEPKSAEEQSASEIPVAEMFPEIEPPQQAGYRKIVLPLASLLVLLVVLGYWFKVQSNQSASSGAAPAVHPGQTLPTLPPVSARETPAPMTVTPEPAAETPSTPAQKASQTQFAKQRPEDVVADSVRPAPIHVAPSTAPSKAEMKDQGPVNAPSITSASGDLAALKLPGVTDTPELRTQSGITGGKPVHQVKPQYPMVARERHIEGDVVLSVHILKNGMVGNVHRVSGDILLANAAVEAVRTWRYEPLEINGEAQPLDSKVTIQFRLPRR